MRARLSRSMLSALCVLPLFACEAPVSQEGPAGDNAGTSASADTSLGAASCADIHQKTAWAKDGNYVINVRGTALSVYCAGMTSGVPKEYLTLPHTLGDANYSASGYAWATPQGVRTTFTRVRFLPASLSIDGTDATFAQTVAPGVQPLPAPLPYGLATDCVWNNSETGTGNIDLRGTPFAVARDQFQAQGWYPAADASYSSNDQVVSLRAGGYCGAMATGDWGTQALKLTLVALGTIDRTIGFTTMKNDIMNATRYPAAYVEDDLGYAWVAGCSGPYVGDDMLQTAGANGGTAWMSNTAGSCNGEKAYDRGNIVYKNWAPHIAAENIALGDPIETSGDVFVTTLTFNNSSGSFDTTYNLPGSNGNKLVLDNTALTTFDFRDSVPGVPDIFHGNAPFTGPSKEVAFHLDGRDIPTTIQLHFDATGSAQIVAGGDVSPVGGGYVTVGAHQCSQIDVFNTKHTVTYPYSAKMDLYFELEFDGYLRWSFNRHKGYYQGSGGGHWDDRPDFSYTFGDTKDGLSAWDAIRGERSSNGGAWEWSGIPTNGWTQTEIDALTGNDTVNRSYRRTIGGLLSATTWSVRTVQHPCQ